MATAKWWADPSWIHGSFLFSDPAGTRIGQNILMYPFWNLGSFESVVMTTTFLNLFMLGGIIFLIAKEIQKPTIIFMILMHLILFSGLGDKSFYSGEWIFGGAEPKTFCYFFCLSAILFYIRGKHLWTFSLMAVATYFHILVGGWILIILLLDSLLQKGIRPTLKNGIIFGVAFLPLFAYLLSTYFQKGSAAYEGLDKIYIAQIHNHLKPWLVPGKEYRFYLGLLYAAIAAAIAFYRRNKVDAKLSAIYRLSIYAFIIPATLTLFAPWDWFAPFLKAYPFRLTMIQKVLFYIAICLEISSRLEKVEWQKQITLALSLIFIVSAGLRLNKNIVKRWNNYKDQDLVDVVRVLTEKYQPGTKVFYLDTAVRVPDDKFDPLSRMSRMDVYFSNKLIPSKPDIMQEWYRRKLKTIELQEDPSKINTLIDEKIEVVVSKRQLPLELVSEVREYKIYNLKL